MDYITTFRYDSGKALVNYDTDFTGKYNSKSDSTPDFEAGIKRLRELQSMLYARGRHGVLIILQAMDAAGKDGVIKHVMAGVNPQGCQVKSFKAPSEEELAHDFMWRCFKALPERGNIGIFNRSYYEEVLIVKVHPDILKKQNLPYFEHHQKAGNDFWTDRYNDINNFEKYFTNNGFRIIKFFLNVSKEEQKKRFLSRIDKSSKNWKFTMSDVSERQHWDKYSAAYEQMLMHTNSEHAPWYVIPADKKWFMRNAVCQILVEHLESLNLSYPKVSQAHLDTIAKARVMLEEEKPSY